VAISRRRAGPRRHRGTARPRGWCCRAPATAPPPGWAPPVRWRSPAPRIRWWQGSRSAGSCHAIACRRARTPSGLASRAVGQEDVGRLILYPVYFGELYPLRPDVIACLDDTFRPFPGGATSSGGAQAGRRLNQSRDGRGRPPGGRSGADPRAWPTLRAHHPPAARRVTATPRPSSSSARTSSTCAWAASMPWSASPWTPSETTQTVV
jgi:hypothetical protein